MSEQPETAEKLRTEQYPELGKGPVSTKSCIDPAFFELERDKVFRKSWLCVGQEIELPEKGSFFVKDLPGLKASIIIVRDRAGKVGAFHNVCRHRGNKVEWEADGRCAAFTCKFHGWSYKLDGSLADVPDEERFFDFDKSENGLLPIHVGVWRGFIFVHLAEKPEETLEEYLAEFNDILGKYPLEEMTKGYAYRAELNCNWKVELDAQMEGYHAPLLHRHSAGKAFRDLEKGTFHGLFYKLLKRHRMMSAPFAPHEPSASEAIAAKFGSSMWLKDENDEDLGLNPSQSDNWGFDLYSFFPNFQLVVTKGVLMVYWYWPVSHRTMVYEARFMFMPPKNAGERFAQEFNVSGALRDVQMEDMITVEATQDALESNVIEDYLLQDEEILLRHAYKVIDEAVEE